MAKVRKTRAARTLAGVSAIALGLTGVLAASGAAFAAPQAEGPDNPAAPTEGSLTIHKRLGNVDPNGVNDGTLQNLTGSEPLGGVVFDVYQLGYVAESATPGDYECVAVDLTKPADWTDKFVGVGKAPATVADLANPADGAVGELCAVVDDDNPTVVTTNSAISTAEERAVFGQVTLKDVALSAYYVVEKSAANAKVLVDNGDGTFKTEAVSVVAPAVPFFVTVPMPIETRDEGGKIIASEWEYAVNVYPKNQDAEKPTKTVDDDLVSLTVGQEITWTISAPVPNTDDPIEEASVYDQIDTNLGYTKTTSVKIKYTDGDGNPQEEILGTPDDYTVVESSTTGEASVTWALTDPTGLTKLNDLRAEKDVRIEVAFVTTVETVPSTGIVENAPGTIGNGYGASFNEKPTQGENTPGKSSGLLAIKKVDEADPAVGLPSAQFAVYALPATAVCPADVTDELKNSSGDPVLDGDNNPVKLAAAYATGESNADGVVLWSSPSQATPNTDLTQLPLPVATWQGTETSQKPDGDYTKSYCVYETKAPAGYTAQTASPQTVNIPAGALVTGNDIQWVNKQNDGPDLPLTGAQGTMLLIVGGLGLVAVAFGAHMVIRNRQKRNA